MLEIWMVRHGETDWNVEKRIQGNLDVPLNERGIRQAHRLGQSLKGISFDVIYTSDLSRAATTAAILNEYVELPLIPCKILRERAFGCVEGMLREEAVRLYPDGFPDLEPNESLRARVEEFLLQMRRQHKEGRILCVSHGLFIHLLLELAGADIVGGLGNTSVSCLTLDESGATVLSVNQLLGSA